MHNSKLVLYKKIIYKLGSYRISPVFIGGFHLFVAEVENLKEFSVKNKKIFYIHVTVHRNRFLIQ